MSETPQYRLLEPAFFAPDLLPPGTIIKTDAVPGPHLEPWNEAAAARMEEWYNEEHDEIDPKTMKPTGQKVRPHAKYRPAPYVGGKLATAEVVEAPEPSEAMGQSLAELSQRKMTDQRPPPARRFKKLSPLEAAEAKPAVEVVVPGPAPTVKGGPGQ